MDSGETKTLFARIGIAALAFATVIAICAFFSMNMQLDFDGDPEGLKLNGPWKFRNGPADLRAGENAFPLMVNVPEPLQVQLQENLAQEFWYQKTIQLPEKLLSSRDPLALFLGTIKGEHEVYWNGELIGSGEKQALGLYYVPRGVLKNSEISLKIKILRPDHLFPGVVSNYPIGLGRYHFYEAFRETHFFESGVKPLIPATFKICLFFLFATMFLFQPKKKEYFSFALFALFSAVSVSFYSRFVPGYFDFYLRNRLTFLFMSAAFAMIPWVTADVLRVSGRYKLILRLYGIAASSVFVSAIFWITNRENEILLYRLAGQWIPVLVGIPAGAICLFSAFKLNTSLSHRRNQILSFSVFLAAGSLSWFHNAGAYLSFVYLPYPELWDIGLYAGLAMSTTMDMRFAARRSERAGKLIPKWFSAFLANHTDCVTLELPMVIMAIDTVSYTKLLSELDDAGKSRLHENIRSRMSVLSEKFGAQRLSDRGDGAIFGWDFGNDMELKKSALRSVIAAAGYLTMESENSMGIKFRIGIAAGLVRGELKGGEASFLGEPLNIASRLESIAKPGTVLLDETVVPFIAASALEKDWIKIGLKGVEYRARPLAKAG